MPNGGKPERTRPAGGGPGARWALAMGMLVAGIGGLAAIPSAPTDATATIGTGAIVAAPAPAPTADDQAAPVVEGTAAGQTPGDAPTRLELPELDDSAAVLPVSVADDGNLGIPEDPQVLGWWRSGARPDSSAGAVLIDGHVDSDRYGIGFFVHLRRLRPGEHVVLTDGTGARTRWRIVQARKYPRDLLPADQLFSTDGPLRLILITCGGVFDHRSHSYPDNLVVLAVPDGG
jgi:hypothetical protein